MKKLLNSLSLLVAVGALSTLAGCELYFGNGGNGDDSTVGGGGSSVGSGGTGWECTTNSDCSSGCYCAPNNTCTEGGFCTDNSDCGSGYFCDTGRSSCEPNPQPQPGCTADTDCDQAIGEFCDVPTGTCTQGSCAGDITCTTAEPVCPTGDVPLIYNGCYTGSCFAYGSCSDAPTCKNINDETDCLSRANDCSATYTGLNCTKADGTACHSGDSGCTCESFVFATCADKTASTGRLVQDARGRMLDASQLMLH